MSPPFNWLQLAIQCVSIIVPVLVTLWSFHGHNVRTLNNHSIMLATLEERLKHIDDCLDRLRADLQKERRP